MKRTPTTPDLSQFPEEFRYLLENRPVFDSSCSKEAKVWFIDEDGGLFLKSAPGGRLKEEAEMNRFFHSRGLGPEVLSYLPGETDWMLTVRIPGEDCTHPAYLSDPKRLCDTTAALLRQFHETDFTGCPVQNRTECYLTEAARNYRAGIYEHDLFPDNWGFGSAEAAWQEIQRNARCLKMDTLLHGDYCLPNILLDNWRFSGFIDLGKAGVGDRHFDIFWGAWTLLFNLKTNAYYDRFLDAYGRDCIQPELLKTIAALEGFTE